MQIRFKLGIILKQALDDKWACLNLNIIDAGMFNRITSQTYITLSWTV